MFLRKHLLLVGIFITLALPKTAFAEPPQSTAYTPESDPFLPTGIALTSLAGAGFISGIAAFATMDGERRYEVGTSVLAASGALTAIGVPVLILGATGDPPQRNNHAMAVSGAVITGVGAMTTAGALGFMFAPDGREPSVGGGSGASCDFCGMHRMLGFPILGAGVVLLGVGIPLWAVGAKDPSEPPDTTEPVALPTAKVGPGSFELSWVF